MHCLGDCPPADPKRDKKQEQAQQAEDRLKRGKELECPADPQGEDDELVANWTANGEEGEQPAEGKLALLQWTCSREGIARTEQTGQERGRAEEDPVDRAYRCHPAEPWVRDQDGRYANEDHSNACRSQTESCCLQPCRPRDQLPLHWVILPNNLVTSTTLKGSTAGGAEIVRRGAGDLGCNGCPRTMVTGLHHAADMAVGDPTAPEMLLARKPVCPRRNRIGYRAGYPAAAVSLMVPRLER